MRDFSLRSDRRGDGARIITPAATILQAHFLHARLAGS
jgi:hypothetical protein